MTPVGDRPLLAELARRRGIAVEYWDWQGHHRVISAETIVAVLRAFGVEAGTDEDAEAALREAELSGWRRMLPRVLIGTTGEQVILDVHVPHGDPLTVEVLADDGTAWPATQLEHHEPPRWVGEQLTGEARFALPADLPPGYHTVRAGSPSGDAECLLVVAPPRLDLDSLPAGQSWGLMAQLYSVRSRGSWGLGDFADLATLGRYGAGAGAEFVLVNPLHAGDPVPPLQNSPYLPTSRRFLNPIYIRVEDVPEYEGLDRKVRRRIKKAAAPLLAADTRADLLDRDATWAAKLEALHLVYDVQRTRPRQAEFDRFKAEHGDSLRRFATWCVLSEQLQGAPWPEGYEDLESPAVEEFTARQEDRIDFHAWLQWVADDQLAAAHAAARKSGMAVGVITDLAVGVHPSGADVWALGPALARGVSVGAPPDPFNQLGQDWSQPPWRPDGLAELGYAPYREMLRTALRHAGGLRIDHVMGLFRLWCIPHGATPEEGTYVYYDHHALVSILLLEAHRAGCLVIGEDLGVVEPWVRDYLAERGICGTSILWFEVDGGRSRPPEALRELCLATVTTHDLPPTAGYLAGSHVRLRDELGLLTRPLAEELAFAEEERAGFLELLRERGLIGHDSTTQGTVEALHVLLTRAPSRLLGVMVSDLVGDVRTQNQPGTDQEYPNWRVPLTGPDGEPVLVEDLAAHPAAESLVTALRRGVPGH